MLRKFLLLISGNTASAALILLRNLAIARLIPVEDYGVAATFIIAIAAVEMASALGLQQQIVQAADGDDPRLQATLHGFQLLRAVMTATLILVAAAPLAAFLGIPDVAWAYQVLAVVPLLNALVHLDIHRLQRRMQYRPMLLSTTVPAALSCAAVWPLAAVFGDWQVMLWAIVIQAAAGCAGTHLLAQRRYALALDRAIIARVLRFGWPLLANSMLLFFVMHGEKLVVGRELGMAVLGMFAIGVTLTMTPTLVLAKAAQSFYLPQLSRAFAAAAPGAPRLAAAAVQTAIFNGTVLALGVGLFGAPFVHIVLGTKYGDLVPLLAGMAAVAALRVFKAGPGTVALAQARTGNALAGNLARVAALPVAWVALAGGAGLETVIAIAAAAEGIGFALVLWLAWRRCGLDVRRQALPIAAAVLFLGLVVGLPHLAAPVAVSAALLLSGFAGLFLTLDTLRSRLLRRPPGT